MSESQADKGSVPKYNLRDGYSAVVGDLPPCKYDDVLKKAYNMAWDAVTRNEDDGWVQHSSQPDSRLTIYTKKPSDGSNINFCKGISTIDGTPEDIRCVFISDVTRSVWDPMFDKGHIVEAVDPNTNVAYGSFKAPWPVSGRDFCTIGRSMILDNGNIFIFFTNIVHPKCPETKKFVRGELIYSATLIEPVSSTQCRVTYALGNDPKGSIPQSLINQANLTQPMCVLRIGDMMKNTEFVKKARDSIRDLFEAFLASEQTRAAAAANPAIVGNLDQSKFSISVSPLPPTKYDEKLQAIEARARRAVEKNEDDGWIFHSDMENIAIYTKPDETGGPVNFCKGIGTINATPEVIRSVFACADTRNTWDSMYKTGKVLEQIDTNTVISYAAFNAPWPVSGRDFCSIGRSIVHDDGSIFVFYGNHEDPRAPENKEFVRGELIYSALSITPIDENSSRVIYALGNNPKGKIPKSLVNAANVAQPLCISKIAQVINESPTIVQQALQSEQGKYQKLTTAPPPSTSTSTGGDEDNLFSGDLSALNQDDYFISLESPPEIKNPDVNVTPSAAAEKYVEALKEARSVAQQALDNTHIATPDKNPFGWEFHKNIEGVDIWLKPQGEINLSKGVFTIDATPQQVHAIFGANTTRSEWDTMFNSSKVIEYVDANTTVGYSAFNAPWPVSGRDFIAVSRSQVLPDGSIIQYGTSVEHPNHPEAKPFVRGKLIFSALLVKPVGDKQSHCTYCLGSDPCGGLSAALKQAAAVGQPLCLLSIQNTIKKNPALIDMSMKLARDRFYHLMGIKKGEDIPPLPYIAPVEWPSSADVTAGVQQQQQDDSKSNDNHQWLTPLHEFHQQSTMSTIYTVLKHAGSNGGLYRLFQSNYAPSSPPLGQEGEELYQQNLRIGVLGLKLTNIRGKFLMLFRDSGVRISTTIRFHDNTHVQPPPNMQPKTPSTPAKGSQPKSSSKDADTSNDSNKNENKLFSPTSVCFDVYNLNSFVYISLYIHQQNSTACVGNLRLTLGELLETGNGKYPLGHPQHAKQLFIPLNNVPMELDSSAQYAELVAQKTKSGKLRQQMAGDDADYSKDPRGIFVCLESCLVLSKLRAVSNEIMLVDGGQEFIDMNNENHRLTTYHNTLKSDPNQQQQLVSAGSVLVSTNAASRSSTNLASVTRLSTSARNSSIDQLQSAQQPGSQHFFISTSSSHAAMLLCLPPTLCLPPQLIIQYSAEQAMREQGTIATSTSAVDFAGLQAKAKKNPLLIDYQISDQISTITQQLTGGRLANVDNDDFGFVHVMDWDDHHDSSLTKQQSSPSFTTLSPSILPTGASPTNTLSAELLIRNFTRLLFALSPLMVIVQQIIAIITWNTSSSGAQPSSRSSSSSSTEQSALPPGRTSVTVSPLLPLLTCVLYVVGCMYYSEYIIPICCAFVVWSVILCNAEYYFLMSSYRSSSLYSTLIRKRYMLTSHYTHKLAQLIPYLSPTTKACGLLLQVLTSRVATILERLLTVCSFCSPSLMLGTSPSSPGFYSPAAVSTNNAMVDAVNNIRAASTMNQNGNTRTAGGTGQVGGTDFHNFLGIVASLIGMVYLVYGSLFAIYFLLFVLFTYHSTVMRKLRHTIYVLVKVTCQLSFMTREARLAELMTLK